jgi:hypothetical protein
VIITASPSSQPSQGPTTPSSDTARDNKSFIKNVVLETSYENVGKCVYGKRCVTDSTICGLLGMCDYTKSLLAGGR